MSAPPNVRDMLLGAERAARDGEFASADELLRSAASIQEAELGPLHPDLANTLNNLAIVAEKTGRLADAETFYRRAVAIASASLPADDPMVAAARQNFEDFCLARGLTERPAVIVPPGSDSEFGLPVSAREYAAGEVKTPTDVRTAESDLTTQTAAPSSAEPLPVLRAATAPLALRTLATLAVGVALLLTAALLVMRSWSSREPSGPAPTSTAPLASEPAIPRASVPVPIEQPPKAAPRDHDRAVAADRAPARGLSSDAITLATVQLCRTFSTSGVDWRCDPAGNPMAPGPLVLYTRVRSSGDAVVVHRWYRGQTLRQAVRLTIRANTTAGYRTYSRQMVDRGEDWRVEVRSASGDLLHEQRWTVR